MNEILPIPCERCHASGLLAGLECEECRGKGYRCQSTEGRHRLERLGWHLRGRIDQSDGRGGRLNVDSRLPAQYGASPAIRPTVDMGRIGIPECSGFLPVRNRHHGPALPLLPNTKRATRNNATPQGFDAQHGGELFPVELARSRVSAQVLSFPQLRKNLSQKDGGRKFGCLPGTPTPPQQRTDNARQSRRHKAGRGRNFGSPECDSKGSPEIGTPRMGTSPLRAIRQATLAGAVRTFENGTAGAPAVFGNCMPYFCRTSRSYAGPITS